MSKAEDKKTLAVIPCYNEEITIGSIVLKTKRYVDKVLVIDDGSNDDTSIIAQEAGATVISHKTNKGKSAAVRTGFKHAIEKDYDYIVTLDGDGQHNPDEIPLILNSLINNGGNIDISIGFRSGDTTEMPRWRRVGKRVLDYTTSFGNGGVLTDSQSGFRAFNKKAVKSIVTKLKGDAFSVESEQLIRAHELGLGVGQTHISCKYNDLDTSTKDPTSHGLSVLAYIIWLVAEKRPLLFIGVPGFIFVILGIFLGILTLQSYNQSSIFPISYAILTSIFLIIGTIAMFFGLMLNTLPQIFRRFRMIE